jgi:hypothetical protein
MNRVKFVWFVGGAIVIALATYYWLHHSEALSLFDAPLGDP